MKPSFPSFHLGVSLLFIRVLYICSWHRHHQMINWISRFTEPHRQPSLSSKTSLAAIASENELVRETKLATAKRRKNWGVCHKLTPSIINHNNLFTSLAWLADFKQHGISIPSWGRTAEKLRLTCTKHFMVRPRRINKQARDIFCCKWAKMFASMATVYSGHVHVWTRHLFHLFLILDRLKFSC